MMTERFAAPVAAPWVNRSAVVAWPIARVKVGNAISANWSVAQSVVVETPGRARPSCSLCGISLRNRRRPRAPAGGSWRCSRR